MRGTILSSIVDYLSSYKKFSQFNAEEAYRNRYLKFYYLLEYDNGINKRKLIVNLKKKKKKSNKGKFKTPLEQYCI